MIVVSDTSPILNLALTGRLDLLRLLYHQVLVPPAVYKELTETKHGLPPAIDLPSSPWLIVAAAVDRNRVRELRESLDPGEAEAIVVAIERRADLLRRTAIAAGLKVTGLLGVIAKAKHAGLIELAKPLLDELIQTAHFWIGPELYAEVLADLGE